MCFFDWPTFLEEGKPWGFEIVWTDELWIEGFLQLWLSPGKLLWQSSSHCWMMPNKFLLVPTKSHEPEQVHCPTSCYSISKFSHNSFSCVGHGSFMICMIAIQSTRPGLCTLILWKWCFLRDKIIDDSKLTAVLPNRVSSHHPKYVHQLARTCFWCFGKALEGGISEHFVEMEVLWQNLIKNEVLLRDELTNWWWNSALSYSPYVFLVFGKGVVGIGYFGRSKLDFWWFLYVAEPGVRVTIFQDGLGRNRHQILIWKQWKQSC